MADFYLDYRGSDYNGGGYDSTIAGATVNLASGQYAALTASGLECTAGSTTVTSVHGGFTTDMIGNIINIYRGSNFDFHYYFVTGVPNSTTLELDATPASSSNAVSGVGKVGGAWETFRNTRRTTNGSYWPISNGKVTGGDTIWVRGNGELDPASPQYYVQNSYMMKNNGSRGNYIRVKGYNGRPGYKFRGGNLYFHQDDFTIWENLKIFTNKGTYSNNYATIDGGAYTIIKDCIVEQSGEIAWGLRGQVQNCYLKNSAPDIQSTTNRGYHAILVSQYNMLVKDNVIENWQGNGIYSDNMASVENNLIICRDTGIYLPNNNDDYGRNVVGNTIQGAEVAIRLEDQVTDSIQGNLITNCQSGIYFVGSASDENSNNLIVDYNAFYNTPNTHVGVNLNSGVNDVYLTANPYLDSGNGDYSLNNNSGGGKECRGAHQSKITGYSKTNTYRDIGCFQTYNQ